MGNTGIFIIGLLIFVTYMFFLLRMISKQQEIQKNEENTILRTESYEKKNQKDWMKSPDFLKLKWTLAFYFQNIYFVI